MNVVVADDDPVVRHLVKRLVESWGYSCLTAVDGNEAWAKLQAPYNTELAILDWEMPGKDGVEIARALRAVPQPAPYRYILLLTARDGRGAFEALTSGADDYVTKPFDPQELRARLHVGSRILGLQRDLVAAYETAQHQASHDCLTGLLNRRMLLSLAQQELDRAAREDRSISTILCDIDHFKQVNDTHGHLVGDGVLIEVARRIRGAVRSYDQVGRYGGEEFLMLASSCDLQQAAALAERVRTAVDKLPIEFRTLSLNVSVSLGVASARGTLPLDQLLAAADAALYSAKRKGRNRIEVASETDLSKVEMNTTLHPKL